MRVVEGERAGCVYVCPEAALISVAGVVWQRFSTASDRRTREEQERGEAGRDGEGLITKHLLDYIPAGKP